MSKRMGRPITKMPDGTSDRKTYSVRLRGEIREAIVAAALTSGRSLSEEIEYRVDRSFRDDDVRNLLREAIGDYGDAPKHEAVPFRGMVTCPICGNKRCPRAGHPEFRCTGSNELGQVGILVGKP